MYRNAARQKCQPLSFPPSPNTRNLRTLNSFPAMSTHNNTAFTCTPNPARPIIKASFLTKILPAFAAGMFAFLFVAAIPRVNADPPAISVTDQGTQVDGNLNITGDLLKNGVPWNPSTTLTPATASILGGIKVGAGLSITSDGILSTTGGGGSSLINASIVEAANATNAATLSQQNPSILYVVPKTETIDGSVWFAGKLIVGERPPNPEVLLTPAMTGNTTPSPFAVTASSLWDSNLPNAAWHCFDQVLTANAWSSRNITDANGYATGCWITIDLGAPRTLVRVALAARNDIYKRDSARQFTISVSSDGSTWQTAHESSDLGPTEPDAAQIYYDQAITPVSGRYIRLTINRTFYPNENASMGEIYYYGY